MKKSNLISKIMADKRQAAQAKRRCIIPACAPHSCINCAPDFRF